MFCNRIGPQADGLCTVITQEGLDKQFCETAAEQMLLTPLWQSAQDVIDRILVLARGKQAEGGSGATQLVTADVSQFQFLTPPSKLNRQYFVVELFPGRHVLLSHLVVAAHGEPGPQHHVKSGVPQPLGNLNVWRNSPIEHVRELPNRPAVHASEKPRICLHILLAPNGQWQRVTQNGSVLLRLLIELLPPRIGTARCQHDPGRRLPRPQLTNHPCDETPPSFLGVVHHHQQLSGHLRESSQLLIRHLGRRGQKPRVPSDRGQIVAQLRSHTRLTRTASPRHNGNGDIGIPSVPPSSTITRHCHRPFAKLTHLGALLVGHDAVPRLDQLQGREILGQRGISRSQHLLDVSPRRELPIRGATAQTPNIHAHIPLPVPNILSARRQRSAPVSPHFRDLLNINRQPRARWVAFRFVHHRPERFPIHLQ